MLEKTAASLEPCGLQRVLPSARKSFRSRRQLHTAFWQHGAADVEITSAWQVLMHGVFDPNLDAASSSTGTNVDPRHPALRASTFLLDFLYPTGSLAFLRRFSPVPSDRHDINRPVSTFARVSPRLYSSSASASPTEAAQTEAGNISKEHQENHVEELKRLLLLDDPEDADQLWHQYTSLEDAAKQQYLDQVLVFLSRTKRATDSWKISELFQQIEPSQWDGSLFVAGLEAELILQNTEQAKVIFEKGLENSTMDQSSLVDAFDLMLAAALRSSSKDLVYSIWRIHDKITARLDLDAIPQDLHRVGSVSRLGDIAIELGAQLKKARSLSGVTSLKKLLVRCALEVCPDGQVLTLLRMTNDPDAYERFIRRSSNSPKTRKFLLTQVYKLYRDLPQSCPSQDALHVVFRAYQGMLQPQDKFPGMEMLWGDWFTFHQTPSKRAYQMNLGFYASTGDKKQVYKLWQDYIKTHGEIHVQKGGDTFAHLLQVHAVRGEPLEAQKIFDEISTRFRLEPNRHCWCILLNAYAKAGDYEGAIATFEKLHESLGGLDRVSVGTLMYMAAERGDLGFTIDIYRRARRENIPTNDTAILGSLVEAYCQNDLFREAEDLCARAAMKGLREPRLWNRILNAFALRRNLVGINRLLNRMTDMDVPYNEYTYQELLTGLSLCRQPQHALHLLAVAVKDGAFEVNEGHFHTVMGAFIKTGEGDLAVRMHKMMQKTGFQESADSLVSLMTAFNQWSHLPHKRRAGHSQQTLLGAALRRFYKVYGIRHAEMSPSDPSRSPTQSYTPSSLLQQDVKAYHFSRIVYLCTQMRDFAKVEELVRLYRYVAYGDANSSEPLPIQMLNSIMWADVSEKRYEALQRTWDTAFALAQKGGLSAEWVAGFTNSKKISTRFRYILNDGIKAMQTMYIEQGDGVSLQRLFAKVRSAGFEIDSKNWNLHIQGLIQCHLYKEAFDACEKWLMPNWTGWASARRGAPMKNLIPLDLRRKGSWPRYLRPVSHTLYYLAKGYSELDKMAPWSAETSQIMKRIRADCPRCYRAIISMRSNGSPLEQQILGDDTPLPADEDNQEYAMYPDEGAEYDEHSGPELDGVKGADEDDLSIPGAITSLDRSS
ncbi:hypothetical protein PFICI_04463 [Pestalotiopsis fici W106-1]|uniref:Pentacotripeptide-repeat region of PRORP domain-containing protein n=1 Tax=Pestalotiopsis fici (strain W106-1 / CGMCC3.15140) TaxID=1229662 RepID=W3XAW6_PESFW|nr:uncharacterized protein PFICI_04463 [Pestalotiopsis fici W106-1]ETS82587.1 hypothetical protein PFICI_04463 [Pestalotiopsis fici W106-1]